MVGDTDTGNQAGEQERGFNFGFKADYTPTPTPACGICIGFDDLGPYCEQCGMYYCKNCESRHLTDRHQPGPGSDAGHKDDEGQG